jgi:hypothetical protein
VVPLQNQLECCHDHESREMKIHGWMVNLVVRESLVGFLDSVWQVECVAYSDTEKTDNRYGNNRY